MLLRARVAAGRGQDQDERDRERCSHAPMIAAAGRARQLRRYALPVRRPAVYLLLVLALAGCGGKPKAAPPPTTTAAAPVDVQACNQLEGYIRLVSQVISASVEEMTQSTHPKQLAGRTRATQRNL